MAGARATTFETRRITVGRAPARYTYLGQCLVACFNWSDLKRLLKAESCAVVLHFDVGVGSKEAKAGRSGILACFSI